LAFGKVTLQGTFFEGIIGHYCETGTKHYGSAWMFYQMSFSIIAATIISGSIAGRLTLRLTLRANAMAALLMSGFVYPVCAHWIWGDGWIANRLSFTAHDS